MNARLVAIEARRARLLEHAAAQREQLSRAVLQWSRPIGLIDRGIAAIAVVKSHPALAACAMVALALLRPRGTIRWARRGWALWQTFRWLTKKAAA